MASIKKLLVLLLSLITFVYSFYVIGKLMMFLSQPKSIPTMYTWVFNLLDNQSRIATAFPALVWNTLYIIAFIFQHSFMKSAFIKNIIQNIGLGVAERSIYSLTSSLCLHYMIKNWNYAQSIVLWQIDVTSSNVLWWTFMLIHGFAWMVIYGGSIIMDLPEILGIKQAYYDLKDYAPPMAYKSFELRHLYSHVRHPSFAGLTTILWAVNLMTIDRLVLASLLTTYMYVAWSTDHNDIIYQKCQLKRKSNELKCNFH
ncbi:nurim homolog [Eupeodes corollae]|uniref:nurim homolog n=1 Tax=Eupeodes corollae TaxID=290404 RepID=UPI00249017A6|nr:nurim homolog [Eupeodes corollae]